MTHTEALAAFDEGRGHLLRGRITQGREKSLEVRAHVAAIGRTDLVALYDEGEKLLCSGQYGPGRRKADELRTALEALARTERNAR